MPGKRGTPERFLTTVLMTDIVGSTDHAAELGDAAWRELVQQHHALVRAALRRRGGREIDTAGDGFFAIFDAPAATVACALEVAEAVAKLGIDIRAGIHVGEVEQIGRKVGGISVVIASRIMSAAEPSEVLVSPTVRDLVTGSGLAFEDRGVRELKGVPGEWHVYSVARAEAESVDAAVAPAAHERRAAAVRRAQARPIWERRPRLVAAAVLGIAIVVGGAALLVGKPWQTPALAGISENSIGVIDPARGELIGQIQVGTQPSGIAVGEGYAWVTNEADDSVSQIDLGTRSVVNRIIVGNSPTGIAVSGGSIWVTNSGARTVSRINAATGRVVQEVEVGNAPGAIVAVGDGLWVANATDSTLVRIDAASGTAGTPVGVGASPNALASDGSSMWVASEDLASVSRVDPNTGATIAVVQLGVRPSAVALGSDWLWVASADGTLSWIDPEANRVSATVPVGAALSGIALTDDAVWLGDRTGTVHRVDRDSPLLPARRVTTSASVDAIAAVEPHGVWLATQQSPDSHLGGTLRVYRIAEFAHSADPLARGGSAETSLQGDGLLGYRRTGGAAGAILLPDLATSVAIPSDGGLTYTFNLRPGIFYSTGEPVRATDFRRAIERSFQVGDGWGPILFAVVEGADACVPAEGSTTVERCDLSAGILADDSSNTIRFKLTEADPDFFYKLATAVAHPVPESVSMDLLVDGPFPATGPYVVASTSDTEVHMVRNERFSVWDAAVRPDGFPDEIVFIDVECPVGACTVEASEAALASVENGDADVVPLGRPIRASADILNRLNVQYPDRWHFGSASTLYVTMNSTLPPFDNVDARRAVNFAFDRSTAGAAAVPTCQLLPPGWPGYEPYCPYTASPDASGRWRGPDLERARELVQASGTAGAELTVGPTFAFFAEGELDYLASVLTDIGYVVTAIDRNTDEQYVQDSAATHQVSMIGWIADYLSPANFLQLFSCDFFFINYCDSTGDFEARFQRALDLQTTDRAAANAAWAELDRWAVDQAILAPISNSGGDLVSDRVGNYQFSPTGFPLYDQMWVQ